MHRRPDHPLHYTPRSRPMKASISPVARLHNVLNTENNYRNGKISVTYPWNENEAKEEGRWVVSDEGSRGW